MAITGTLPPPPAPIRESNAGAENRRNQADDARTFGHEEERIRIFKILHDEVSPKLLAAIFEVARVKEDLEAKGLKVESKSVSKAV